MATADDVAAAVVALSGPLDTLKLQKLVYYCQAWHLVWDEAPLFPEPIEAWAGGPVVRSLYNRHRGSFAVQGWPWGDPKRLTPEESETVRVVVSAYGALSGRQLSALTHREEPWRHARGELGPGERGDRVIALDDMAEYYGALDQDENAKPIDELT